MSSASVDLGGTSSLGPASRLGSRLVEAWNAHDPDQIALLHAPDFTGVDVGVAFPIRGRPGAQRAAAAYLRAFPDLHFVVERMVAAGDQVVLMWKARATHRGEVMSIPATNRVVDVQGVWVLTVLGEQIERATCVWDVAGMLRGLGLLPDL